MDELLSYDELLSEYVKIKNNFLNKAFEHLNDKQREAIFELDGPIMILAGAGSGKTTVIVNRIINMINYGNLYHDVPKIFDTSDGYMFNLTAENNERLQNFANTIEKLEQDYALGRSLNDIKDNFVINAIAPWNILAITFTNKAAKELKDRICKAVGESTANQIWASTFHSMCTRILRQYADKINYSRHFTIYDADDIKKVIKSCQKALNIDDKMLSVKTLYNKISHCKNNLIEPSKFAMDADGDARLTKIAQVYTMYQKMLTDTDAMDFDDLIFNTIKLFRNQPEVLQIYQNKFKYIMVDEYQDTNYAQIVLIKMLADKYKNLCIVGDDDQSIYKFRGAKADNIINFENMYPNTKVIRLEQNYRSTKNILNAANALIKNNTMRKDKTLWTKNTIGEKISLHTAYSEHDEADYIATVIENGISKGRKYSDFAVLYRMNSQSSIIEKIFVKSNIPYRILGGTRFYERKEIKDLIAYLSVINNPLDEIRLRRIINQPRRSIGDRTISQAMEIAQKNHISLFEVINNAINYEELQRVCVKLKNFGNIINELIDFSNKENVKVHEIFMMVLEKTNYKEFIKSEKEDNEERLNNVDELYNNIVRYEADNPQNATLSGFLEEVSLLTDVDNYDANSDSVVMMTVHAAKGLEFPVVFLPGFEEGIFPGLPSMSSDDELEEERRLAYVALTRAKQKVYLLNSDSRMIFGVISHNKPSRFCQEIPVLLIEKTKSRDWKKLDPNEEQPRSAQEIRDNCIISAQHFGEVVGGIAQKKQNAYSVGMTVHHNIFGNGVVRSAVPMGNDTMLEIAFTKAGSKKLMANYAPLTVM